MDANRNELRSLLKSRAGLIGVGLPMLGLSLFCLWVIRNFLKGRQKFDAFDWFVFLFFNEFFGATLLLAILLLICALFDPPWLQKRIATASHHLNWLALSFFYLIAAGMLGMLVVVPVLVAFGFLE